MPSLRYLVGDATRPEKVPALVTHICNDLGLWGAGFVLALSKVSKMPELRYREWLEKSKETFKLGEVQIADFLPDIKVANMIAQNGVGIDKKGNIPLRYDSLEVCLNKVYDYAKTFKKVTVHMPRIGCGLAGGKWEVVEMIIKKTMTVDTYVYDFQQGANK